MSRLTGKTEKKLRQDVAHAVSVLKLSFEDFFQKAAETHAPQLKPKEIERKLRRYRQGCAAPLFVKVHALDTLKQVRAAPAAN